MSNLIENIVNNDLVKAKKIFETRMNEIRDQKLYEAKRCLAADMNEGVGGLTAAQIQARKEMGWRKASEVLPDPRDVKLKIPKKKKVAKKKKLGEDTSSFRSDVEAEKLRLQKKYPDRISAGKEGQPFKKKPEPEEQPTPSTQKIRAKRDTGLKKVFPKGKSTTDSDYKKPGIIKRNWNTLMGRQPGYVAGGKSDQEKGGTGGKIVRGTFKGIKRGLEMLGQTGGGVVEE